MGYKIKQEEKKLGPISSTRIPAPPTTKSTGETTRQEKRDMSGMKEFLAKKSGQATQQTGQPPTTLQDTIGLLELRPNLSTGPRLPLYVSDRADTSHDGLRAPPRACCGQRQLHTVSIKYPLF
ncbi:unnamed protein product [Macrosiphum euphorbiae]|uniref:Uncharacterized protein n=1 Tax=Macrosiphum euphorbiae TaxID=13131 RepID=A0AAV0W6T4_9HEMI|nr:unnamed protein product [Macrosiphum euphorbiae]